MSDQNQALAVIYPKSLEPVREVQRLGLSKEELINMTLNVLKSPHSKRAYRRALNDFLDWYLGRGRPALKKAILQEYRADLETAGTEANNINQRLCAIRRMIREAAANGEIDEQAARSAAAVEGIGTPGKSLGIWLTKEEAELFINCIDRSTLAGERDFALICLFLTSGLRRSEMANLHLEDIKQTAGRWVILGIVGKRNKTRNVPIPGWAKQAVDLWCRSAGITEGRIFRPVNKGGRLRGDRLSPEALRLIIEREIDRVNVLLTGQGTELPRVAAHDLRRTFAHLAREGGSAIEQISIVLGHDSIKTTQDYLGTEQDLVNAPCDLLGLDVNL